MRFFITTFGCEANKADSERIETRLRSLGHKKALDKNRANLIVINACSVRQSAVDRVLGEIKKHKNKKIILTGCLLEPDRKKLGPKVDEIWHPDEYFDLIPAHAPKSGAFVPIMTGCNNFCAYCAVPYTRGRERSRPAEEIIKEVKKLAKDKYKEIWLLGQNVNSYKSGKITFPKLLRHLSAIANKCNVRFMSPHPKGFSDELIKTIASAKNIAREIHLPVQSGDDEILKKMNRGYTRAQYIKLVNKIRKAMPGVKISTDAIVGFPGETKKQFQNTVKLFKQIGFSKVYAAKYSPRPGTAAAKLKDNISFAEKKRRWNILNELANKKKKIIAVLGPTASGKSGLAVEIAKKFNGEIISADSRQVYKGVDIGSGKITKKEMKGIKHYLLDVASPKKIFTAVDFKNQAEEAIGKIAAANKIPIICGGTGFYIHALLDDTKLPAVAPDWVLRKKLEKKSPEELFKMLKKLDKNRAKTIDSKNKRRLIRAIEIAEYPRPKSDFDATTSKSDFDILWLGIKKPIAELEKLIKTRTKKMIKTGLEKEVKRLVKKYGWTTVLKNTIGYAEWISKESEKKINLHTLQYAKRQMTWFKKYAPKTKWVRNKKESFNLTRKFLSA